MDWILFVSLILLVAGAACLGRGWLLAHHALLDLCEVDESEWMEVRRELRKALKYKRRNDARHESPHKEK